MAEEQKVGVPEAWKAERDKEAQRRELIGEWRRHLSTKQRDRLETEGAGARFRTAIPLEALKAFTQEERAELLGREETIALIASGVDFEPSPGQFNSPY